MKHCADRMKPMRAQSGILSAIRCFWLHDMHFLWQAGLIRGAALLVDSYAPQLCLYCDQPSYRAEPICDVCRRALIPNRGACPCCALPYCAGAPCPGCQQSNLPLAIIAPFVYDRSMAYLLQRWKYDGQRRLAAAAALLATSYPRAESQRTDTTAKAPRDAGTDKVERVTKAAGAAGDQSPQADRGTTASLSAALRIGGPETLLLPTPLHWRRRLQRGFNQSEDLLRAARRRCPELGEACARARGVRLLRRRATPRQARAAKRDRLRNLQGAFLVEGDVCGRPVLLVDDVCTTGATGLAMATALRDAGACSVTLWCLARTPER